MQQGNLMSRGGNEGRRMDSWRAFVLTCTVVLVVVAFAAAVHLTLEPTDVRRLENLWGVRFMEVWTTDDDLPFSFPDSYAMHRARGGLTIEQTHELLRGWTKSEVCAFSSSWATKGSYRAEIFWYWLGLSLAGTSVVYEWNSQTSQWRLADAGGFYAYRDAGLFRDCHPGLLQADDRP